MRKSFYLYRFVVLAILVAIVIALAIAFCSKKISTTSEIEIVSTNVKEGEKITEDQAKNVAIEQFKILGEKTDISGLSVDKIKKQGEEYYYISSRENTLEIKIVGGVITKVNSVAVIY